MTNPDDDRRQPLRGRVALVAGAGSGIGRATALLLAREGASVVAADLNTGATEELASSTQQQNAIASQHLDVTSESDWEAAIADIVKHWQRLDILVVSAGITHAAPVDQMTLEAWHRVMAINVDGAFLGTKHAVRVMRSSGGGGSIVLVSSASGIKAAPGASAYAASKAALRLFAKSVALECAGDGIRVNTVLPGGVKTASRRDGDVLPVVLSRGSAPVGWIQGPWALVPMLATLAVASLCIWMVWRWSKAPDFDDRHR